VICSKSSICLTLRPYTLTVQFQITYKDTITRSTVGHLNCTH